MDIKTENDVRMLKKLGLDDNIALIIAGKNNNKEELIKQTLLLEKENNRILQEETLKCLVPFTYTVNQGVGEFIAGNQGFKISAPVTPPLIVDLANNLVINPNE